LVKNIQAGCELYKQAKESFVEIRNTANEVVAIGKEVNLKDVINSLELSDVGAAFGLGVLRSGYFGGSTATSPSQVIQPKSESFYQDEE